MNTKTLSVFACLIFTCATSAHAAGDKINCVLVKTKNPQKYGLVNPSLVDRIEFDASKNPVDRQVDFHGFKVRVWTNVSGTLKQVSIKDPATGVYAQASDGWLRAPDVEKELDAALGTDEDFITFGCSTTGEKL